MTNLQKIVEEIFTPEELALIDSGEYKPGRAVLDAKIDLVIAAEREACAKLLILTIRQAVIAEREECADICDQHSTCEGIAQKCAAAIRARGE